MTGFLSPRFPFFLLLFFFLPFLKLLILVSKAPICRMGFKYPPTAISADVGCSAVGAWQQQQLPLQKGRDAAELSERGEGQLSITEP